MAGDNVLPFPNRLIGAGLKVSPDQVLEQAQGKILHACVVIGWDADGKIYVAGSEGVQESVFMMEAAKQWLLAGAAGLR